MSHDMALEITSIVPHAKLYIMYGQTEAAARLSYLPPDDLIRKHGSVGKGIAGVSLEVINENGEKVKTGEVGEVRAKGDNVMLGYWGKEEDTKNVLRDGWLFTGDTATIDDEGYIYILGRRTEMIKSGASYCPREIEEIILKYTKIAEAAVIGEPDTILGEAISAFIVIKDGYSCQEKEILQHCHENLPVYKMPKTIHFISSLPKTDSGKIKKGVKRFSHAGKPMNTCNKCILPDTFQESRLIMTGYVITAGIFKELTYCRVIEGNMKRNFWNLLIDTEIRDRMTA